MCPLIHPDLVANFVADEDFDRLAGVRVGRALMPGDIDGVASLGTAQKYAKGKSAIPVAAQAYTMARANARASLHRLAGEMLACACHHDLDAGFFKGFQRFRRNG